MQLPKHNDVLFYALAALAVMCGLTAIGLALHAGFSRNEIAGGASAGLGLSACGLFFGAYMVSNP